MPNPRWIIDTAEASLGGLYLAQEGGQVSVSSLLVRNDEIPRTIQLLVNTASATRQPLDVTGGSLKLSIGDPNTGAIAGTWELIFNGAGVSGIAFDVTQTDLQNIVDAHGGFSAFGGAKVTIIGNSIAFRFVPFGPASAITVNTTALIPVMVCNPEVIVAGAVATYEIQLITFERAKYVEENGWAVAGAIAGAVTTIVAGSDTQRASFRVALSETATGGSFSLSFGKSHKYDIKAVANTAAKETGTITCVADSGGSLQSTYFDLPGAAAGSTIRFWVNEGGAGVAPAAPAVGSLQAIATIVAADTEFVVASKIAVVVEAHADFTATVVGNVVTWVASVVGPKTAGVSAATSGHAVVRTITGNNGQLDQKAFIIYDETGSVGCWFDASAAGANGYPSTAAAADRQLRFVIAAADTAATVAGVIHTAILADAKFTSTNTGNLVRVTVDASGLMPDADIDGMAGLAGFTVETNTAGESRIIEAPFNAESKELETLLEGDFSVQPSGRNNWTLTALELGTWTAPTMDATRLTQPTYFTGTFTLTDPVLRLALACTTEDTLPAFLEVELTDALGVTSTVLRMAVEIARDQIAAAATPPPGPGSSLLDLMMLPSIGLAGGLKDEVVTTGDIPTYRIVDGQADNPAYGAGIYSLKAGTVATALPNFQRPFDYGAGIHQCYWERI